MVLNSEVNNFDNNFFKSFWESNKELPKNPGGLGSLGCKELNMT